ncbi:MAG: Crp/Fnr family transcriptional regulator [Bacteriovoracaceae bacterium]|nr:Crp/Fnr family transcriptional regulator [Bacteriovoracaceae bacterium]
MGVKYTEFFKMYSDKFGVPEEEWLKLEEVLTEKSFKKGELLTRPGDNFMQLAVVIKGLFRLFYIGQEGREYVKTFRGEGEIAGPYAEILLDIPSRTFIEAMEDSQVLLLSFEDFVKFGEGHQCWKTIRYEMAEEHFVQKEKREFELLQLSAAERYNNFLVEKSHLVDRIPQYHVASYLGITPVALSRILKKIK